MAVIVDSATRVSYFTWTGGTPPYSVQYRAAGTQDWHGLASLTDTLQVPLLPPNASYEWQIQAGCAKSFSTSHTFVSASCNPGYQGPDCMTEIRDKFLGVYVGSQHCSDGDSSSYNMTVASSADGVLFVTVSDGVNSYTGKVNSDASDSTFSFINQNTDGTTLSATGQLTSNVSGRMIHFTSVLTRTGSSLVCTFDGLKQ
ncbi:MAG: hypothetical protein JSS76_12030 [Bacteroidetes bacterium]|nr:hypothetical protein [Bacteroidota bacterium]